jgi:hypothetical protein
MTTRLPVNGLTVDLDLSGYATKEDLQTISLTPGPKGDKGDDGEAGPKGDKGEAGAKGDAGAGTKEQLDGLQKQIDALKVLVDKCCAQPAPAPKPGEVAPAKDKDTDITVIETSTTGAKIILNLDSRNTNSLARTTTPGVWKDLTSNKNDATVFGTVTYGTLGGQNCAVFPGGNANYAQAKSNVYFTGSALTIQSWVYVSKVGNWNRIIDFGNGAGQQCVLLSNSFGQTGCPGIYLEGSQFQATKTLPLNSWHMIVGTWVPDPQIANRGTAKIFIDGVLSGSGLTAKPPNIMRKFCYISKSNWGNPPDPNMEGGIGSVQIYDGALTDAEVMTNFNSTKSYYGL